MELETCRNAWLHVSLVSIVLSLRGIGLGLGLGPPEARSVQTPRKQEAPAGR